MDSDLSSPLDKQSSGQHDYTYVPVFSSITSLSLDPSQDQVCIDLAFISGSLFL